jgi:hypothetical protein
MFKCASSDPSENLQGVMTEDRAINAFITTVVMEIIA